MLDVSPGGLAREARHAEARREPFIERSVLEEEVRLTAGPGFRSDWDEPGRRENFGQQWLSLFAPLLLSGNPRVRLRTSRPGPGAQHTAKGLQAELNLGIAEQDMRRLNELLFTDWGFGTTVALTTITPAPGLRDVEDREERPNTTRIPREHYLHDSLAYEAAKDRWRAHLNLRDREDMLSEARRHPEMGWNVELLRNLDVDSGLDRTLRGEMWEDREGTIRRHEVAYLEVWVREYTLDRARGADGRWFRPSPANGHNGTILTIPWGQWKGGSWPGSEDEDRVRMMDQQGYLREPFPYYGPPEGPYDVDGAICIRNQSEFLGPIPAARRQVDDLNDVADAIAGAIRAYKRGVAIDGTAPDDLAEVVTEFQDMTVFRIGSADDIRRHLAEIAIGGPSRELYEMFVFRSEALARNSGLDDAQQGAADPDATATAVSIAARSSGRRSGWVRQKFVGYLEGILRKWAWYYFEAAKRNTERLLAGMGPDESQIADPLTGELIKLPVTVVDAGQAPLTFDDFELTIELFSLAMTSEEQIQAQAQNRLAFYTQVAPMIPQLSLFIDCQQAFEEYGEMMGDPGLTKAIDFRMAAMLGQMQMQMGMMPPAQPQTSPQPRVLFGPPQAPGIGGMGGQRSQGSQFSSPTQNGSMGSTSSSRGAVSSIGES